MVAVVVVVVGHQDSDRCGGGVSHFCLIQFGHDVFVEADEEAAGPDDGYEGQED